MHGAQSVMQVGDVLLRPVSLAYSERGREGMLARRQCAAALLAVVCMNATGCLFPVSHEALTSPYPAAGTMRRDVRAPGGTRSYVVHLPVRAAGTPRPLLLVLHGSGGSGRGMADDTRLDSIADLRGFVVAYPDGVRGILGAQTTDWNAGTCCGLAQRGNVDDVGFLRVLIDDVSSHTAIDPSRVYVAGFSDGGRMTYRAGCELSDRIAAIAVVAGSLVAERCQPARVPSLIAIHGTRDTDVAFDEAVSSRAAQGDSARRATAGAEKLPPSVVTWGRLAGCTGTSASQPDVRDSRVASVILTGCVTTDISVFSIRGGTHEWPRPPNADDIAAAERAGSVAIHKLPASEVIVDFLLRHRR